MKLSSSGETTNEFWRFSLSVYAAPGVADECLDLQDRFGIDVNLLLFAAYTGSQRLLLSSEELDRCSSLVQQWRDQVIRPLRDVRRAIKALPQQDGVQIQRQIEDIRGSIKSIELESEKVQQDLLFHWLENQKMPQTADPERAIRSNIETALRRLLSAQPSAGSPKLISASVEWAKNGTS